MPTLLLLGAGGHARVVADAALRQGAWRSVTASPGADVAVAPAASGAGAPELLPGVALVARATAMAEANAVAGAASGTRDAAAFANPDIALHVAIGDNANRAREAEAVGLSRLVAVVHPQASVSPHAQLGPGCFIAAQAVVAPLATLEAGVIINHGAVVDHDCHLGAFVHVAPGATLAGAVRVAGGVLVGSGARLLPGVTVCAGVTIGAGAVVTQPITEPGTYVGAPARRLP